MKLKISSLLLGIMILVGSCGDQNFGFNISKEVGLEVPISYERDVVIASLGLNPPAVRQELKLSEIDAFSDNLSDINEIGQIIINKMAYEINGVSSAEETPLDDLTISVNAGGENIELVRLTGSLADVVKTDIPLTPAQRNAIQTELLGAGNNLTTEVNIDFQASPSQDIDMSITVFFDITLKIRENGL